MDEILEGQISIFDLEVPKAQKDIQDRKIVSNENNSSKVDDIIDKYKLTASRIIRRVYGALLVEISDKTLYFNSDGINELELLKNIALLPADEILVVNEDKELNTLQLEKLTEMNVTKYIKRKGDENIIIPFSERTVVITPKGWILEYLQEAKFKDDEVYYTKTASDNLAENKNLKENDLVEIEYEGLKHVGKVARIYNNAKP